MVKIDTKKLNSKSTVTDEVLYLHRARELSVTLWVKYTEERLIRLCDANNFVSNSFKRQS